MGQWRPVSNLRAQVSRHPPAVVFFLSLLILSITFVCIGLYSQNHDIKNPDISVDWNRVLGSIAGFKFCTHLNDTDAPLEEDSPRMVEHSDRTNISTSSAHVSLLVPLAFTGDVPDNTAISATMLGSQMGMKGFSSTVSLFRSIKFNNSVNCAPSSHHVANLSTSALYHLLLVSVALMVICVLMSLCGTFSSHSPRSFQGNDLQKESLLSQ
uniref:Transmembrane protein 248-like n=1 Tax=Sinocyclocheilus grahami TaxID=75366 RepID=A0A672N898_SINGR